MKDTEKTVRVDLTDPEGTYIELVPEWIKHKWMFLPDRIILSIAIKRGLIGDHKTIN